jgi:uncharacterized protein YbaP (TraB family)
MAIGSPPSGNSLLRPLLWKVRGKEVYVMGSLHFGPVGGYRISDSVLGTFDAAEIPRFEVSRGEMSLVPSLIRRESGSLAQDLGSANYDQLRRSMSYDPSFETLRPHIVYFNLAIRPYLEMGLTPEGGVESVLQHRAFSRGKMTQGLETAAEQVEMLCSFPIEQVAIGIQGLLANPEALRAICEAVYQGFLNGDVRILGQVRTMMNQMPDMVRILFLEREMRWVPKIQELIADGSPTILVVGALHLVGEQGLIGRLEHQGVMLDRVDAA